MNDAQYERLPNGDTLVILEADTFTLSPVEVARLIEFNNRHTRRPLVLHFPKWPLERKS